MQHKQCVLALVQLPPPVHGAAIVSRDVVASDILNRVFHIVTVPIQLGRSISDMGKLRPRKLLALLRNVARTATVLIKEKPSLVYFTLPPHSGGFYASLPFVALAKLFCVPMLYHFHGKGIRDASKSSLYRIVFAWAMKGAHVIILSERLYDDVSGFLAREQVLILPNALAVSPAPPEDGVHIGSHILFLSNLIESKGPLVLLDALALLKVRGIDFQASFAGTPSSSLTSESFKEAINSRHLADRVRYLGSVAGTKKDDLLRSADVMAFPTFYDNEAFPLVVLEAMGAGLAVVATPEGAIPDIVRDGESGVLVPHRDPGKLADALQRLLENPALCRRMGYRGWEIVTREYASGPYHRRMLDIWNTVMDPRRSR
jgi:glycosyltransferase involved in cell wall biosynthesis